AEVSPSESPQSGIRLPASGVEITTEAETSPSSSRSEQPSEDSRTRHRLVLLYQHHQQPDEQLLETLVALLTSRGHDVFTDRRPIIGVEAIRELERQVRAADAVIPLISAASAQSEMLAYEVQIAHEAAQQQEGKPRLLPIAVQSTGSLPEPLAS